MDWLRRSISHCLYPRPTIPLSRNAAFLFFRLCERVRTAAKQKNRPDFRLVGLVTRAGLSPLRSADPDTPARALPKASRCAIAPRGFFIAPFAEASFLHCAIKKPARLSSGRPRDPGGIQTHDHLLRRQELYSTELPGQNNIGEPSSPRPPNPTGPAPTPIRPAKIKKIPLLAKPFCINGFNYLRSQPFTTLYGCKDRRNLERRPQTGIHQTLFSPDRPPPQDGTPRRQNHLSPRRPHL